MVGLAIEWPMIWSNQSSLLALLGVRGCRRRLCLAMICYMMSSNHPGIQGTEPTQLTSSTWVTMPYHILYWVLLHCSNTIIMDMKNKRLNHLSKKKQLQQNWKPTGQWQWHDIENCGPWPWPWLSPLTLGCSWLWVPSPSSLGSPPPLVMQLPWPLAPTYVY